MAGLVLRDRDGILTKDGFIFRVFGYAHPKDAFICDAEYASAKVFQSRDPRAPRTGKNQTFYKFYDDEGWKLISANFPQYLVLHEMLNKKVVGVHVSDVLQVRRPQEQLQTLLKTEPKDELLVAMQKALQIALENSGVQTSSFGVFGSMLHNFHHPKYSDIDFVVYGKAENAKIRKTLQELYEDKTSGFGNEFQSEQAMTGKRWRFKNFSATEFVWHQRRKQIYGLFDDSASSGRIIKVEFEPVKAWSEITSEYDTKARILQKGWVRLKARITRDDEAPFIPSTYKIEPLEVLSGSQSALEALQVISYMEEFRLQAQKDEEVIVEGNLEEVTSSKGSFSQVTLTYCPRYYEQVLKVIS